jgi:hypothetical protein
MTWARASTNGTALLMLTACAVSNAGTPLETTGGAAATGGSTTGGSTAPTGGTTTTGAGGSATGGSPMTGGSATGGSATGGSPMTGGSPTTGGATGTASGGAGPTGGADEAGGGASQKGCATKTVVTVPQITDFESYDGTTEVSSWSFPFNGTAEDPGAVYAGPFAYDDGTGAFTFAMTAGNATNYGLGASNTEASAWGAGFGLWMNCVDATAFTGVSFSVRGTMPTEKARFSLSMEETSPPDETDASSGGTCVDTGEDEDECTAPYMEFDVTDAWTSVQLPFASFEDGMASTGVSVAATGDTIIGFTFGIGLVWEEDSSNPGTWIPVPAPFELVVDDLAFY